MEKLNVIERHLVVRHERDRSLHETLTRLADTLDDLAARPEPDSAMDQGQLIRWLALAVVLASLGSKALELVAGLLPALLTP